MILRRFRYVETQGRESSLRTSKYELTTCCKYRPFPTIHLPDDSVPEPYAPEGSAMVYWISRDWQSSLAQPNDRFPKIWSVFDALVRCGFKRIEVVFQQPPTPSLFRRRLIEMSAFLIVTIPGSRNIREDLSNPRCRHLVWSPRVIISIFTNSTSPHTRSSRP